MPLESIRQLVSVKEPVRLALPETVLPYHRAREIILNDPDHIVALECPCRAARENPCLPLDVCLIVGEPFASFVMEHHPTRPGGSILKKPKTSRAEDARARSPRFSDAMLGRFTPLQLLPVLLWGYAGSPERNANAGSVGAGRSDRYCGVILIDLPVRGSFVTIRPK